MESEVGVGSTVHIYLPLSKAVETVREPEVKAPVCETERGGSVLVVDDEQPIISLMSMMLKKKGFEAVGYVDAAEALETARLEPARFDVAIVDYTMPGMTGLEFAAALHAIRPQIPIVLATGMMEATDFQVPDSIGIVQVLRKPVPPAELVRVLDEVIRNGAGVGPGFD